MKCIKCGNQLEKDDLFCEKCGNKVEGIVLENENNSEKSDNLSKVESTVKKGNKKVIATLGIVIVVIVLVLLGMNENKKKVATKNYKVDKENCEFIKNYYEMFFEMAGSQMMFQEIDSNVYIMEVEDSLLLNKELKEKLKLEVEENEVKIEKPLEKGKDMYYVCILNIDSKVCDINVITGKKGVKPCVCEFYNEKNYKILEEKLLCDTLKNIIDEALANEDIYDEMLELVESNKGYIFQKQKICKKLKDKRKRFHLYPQALHALPMDAADQRGGV